MARPEGGGEAGERTDQGGAVPDPAAGGSRRDSNDEIRAAAASSDVMAAPARGREAMREEERKGKQGKGRRYGLVDYRALPAYMRDNEYILRYYRCEWPLPQVLLSVFSIHNETLNVWS